MVNKNINQDCNYFEKVFLNYINGKTDEKDTSFCMEHLKGCNTCKNNEDYEELLFAWNKLDSFEEIQPSKHFMAKLQHQVALVEEKSFKFWFKLDFIFNFAKVPVMTAIMLLFTFTTNLSYAQSSKSIYNLKNPSPALQKKIERVSNMKIDEALKNLVLLYKNKKKEK